MIGPPTATYHRLEPRLRAAIPSGVDYATVRFNESRLETLAVRGGVVQPPSTGIDTGVMVTVWAGGGIGYAATSDLTESGLARAAEQATGWARTTAGRTVVGDLVPTDAPVGSYRSPVVDSWDHTSLADRLDLLQRADEAMKVSDKIVDRLATLRRIDTDSLILTSGGGRVEQFSRTTIPYAYATANAGARTQTRSYGRGSYGGQGGREVLDRFGVNFVDRAGRLGEEALELLEAANCPTGTMDVVLAPDQMILQIHESIGHPLELDRILGDERNFAGTSFVTLDMFGTYRYGSELLNVTFDPTIEGQLASYRFDDEGAEATKQYLIRNGILERPLGGALSQKRAGEAGTPVEGVANSRASRWNRPPIDRMANINVEPGTDGLDELIGGVEQGVYLETNNSWSIDDSRNKFQFSCEYGRLIEDGELGAVIRNPSYRGISATFWRSLSGVGDPSTSLAMGTPNCGKGEPNQVISTGHASPACRFSAIDVFGGVE
jgi:predicted Zn-dependent protease